MMLEEKKLTIANISKAMHLIPHALDKFLENYTDENSSADLAASINQSISCYKEIYQQKQIPQTLDSFVNKTIRPPSQMEHC